MATLLALEHQRSDTSVHDIISESNNVAPAQEGGGVGGVGQTPSYELVGLVLINPAIDISEVHWRERMTEEERQDALRTGQVGGRWLGDCCLSLCPKMDARHLD